MISPSEIFALRGFNTPRVHGNGFIQLDLDADGERRLHIWGDPRIPRQEVATPVHNHLFGFESTCIVGRIVNVGYWITKNDLGGFRRYAPAPTPGSPHDTKLEMADPFGHLWELCPAITECMIAGQSYRMQAGDFHETFVAEPTATIMRKRGPKLDGKPFVMVPIGKKPDNDFNRDEFDPEFLWQIIEDTLCR